MSSVGAPVEENLLTGVRGRSSSLASGLPQPTPTPHRDPGLPQVQEELDAVDGLQEVEPRGGEEEREQSPSSPPDPPADVDSEPPSDEDSEPSSDIESDADSDGSSDPEPDPLTAVVPPSFRPAGPAFIPDLMDLNPADPAFRSRLESTLVTLFIIERRAMQNALDSSFPQRAVVEDEEELPEPSSPPADSLSAPAPPASADVPNLPDFPVDLDVLTPFLDRLSAMYGHFYPPPADDSSSGSDLEDEETSSSSDQDSSSSSDSPSEDEDQESSSSEGSSSSRKRRRDDSDDGAADGNVPKRSRSSYESAPD